MHLIERFTFRRRGLVLITALLALALSACDWQSFGFDAAQTRFNHETNPPSALTPRWATNIFGTSPASVANGVVYVGDAFGV